MKMSLTAALLHRLVLLFASPVWQFLPASGSARLASACTPCGPRRGGLLPAALLCRHGAHVAGGARRIPGAPPARGAGHRRGAPRASRLPHQLCASRGALSACAGRVPATYWLLMSGHVVSAPPDYPMTSKNEASGAMFRSAAAKLRACRSALLREAPRRCVPHLPCVGGQQNRSAPLRRLPQSAAGSKRARDAPQHCLTPGRRPRQEAAQEGATAAPPADEPVLLHFVALVEHEGRCGQSPQRGRGRDAACASGLRASL